MSEETKETKDVQDFLLPDNEDIPEKFRGKSYKDVIKSYQESEKYMTKKTQEASEFEKALDDYKTQLEELKAQQKPEAEPETDDDYNYITAKQFKKMQEDLLNNLQKTIQESSTKTQETVMGQIERRNFIASHPELFSKDMDNQAIDATIKTFASIGFANGARSLEEAYSMAGKLAKTLGYVSPDEIPQGQPKVVPSVNRSAYTEDMTPEDALDHMVNFHKSANKSMTDTINYRK